MAEEQFAKLNREILYNEIWEISAIGVSKKYNVQYSELLRLCKEIEIPIPPSGYWTKLRMGKPVEKILLPKSEQSEVILPLNVDKKHSKHSSKAQSTIVKTQEVTQSNTNTPVSSHLTDGEESDTTATEEINKCEVTYRSVDGQHNVYNRKKLYEEVWSKSVVQVAIQYGVSDVAIHKVCKSLNIPVPPRGYWARVRSGEKIKIPPLPATNGITEKVGIKSFEGIKVPDAPQETLAFLQHEERERVLLAAQEMQLTDENTKFHKKIISYSSKVREWNKNDRKPEGAKRIYKNYTNNPPFLAGVISDETLPRVYRILDSLYRQIEKLGGSVNDDLSLTIRNERVTLEILENQDEVNHEITREEAQELIVYEDAKRHNRWASQPNIRKYDYVFNGKLRICIRKSRYFRDSDREKVESRLGDMLIELYEESEVIRKEREALEEAERRKEEEKRRREERRIKYNEEVDKTIALTNISQDYDTACKIRAYINALEPKLDMSDVKTVEYIDWAKKKADWYDPTVDREDELFGERNHEESEERKALKKSYYW